MSQSKAEKVLSVAASIVGVGVVLIPTASPIIGATLIGSGLSGIAQVLGKIGYQIYNNNKQQTSQLTEEQKLKLKEFQALSQNVKNMTVSYQKQLNQAKQEAKKWSDPSKYDEGRKATEDKFIKNLSSIQIPLLTKNQKVKKLIIGPISVGKSSILKKFLNADVKVGRGQTTLQLKKVFQNENVEVYDSPGINKDFEICEFKNIIDLFDMDQFYVCYNSSLKNVLLILRILSVISSRTSQNIFLVRTQCDNFSEEDDKTLEEELEVDRTYLQKLQNDGLISKVYQILATSSKQPNFKDNSRLAQLLKQNQKQFIQKEELNLMKFD